MIADCFSSIVASWLCLNLFNFLSASSWISAIASGFLMAMTEILLISEFAISLALLTASFVNAWSIETFACVRVVSNWFNAISFSSLVASSLSLINPRITSAFWWISFLAADLISITGSILEISSILCFLIFLTSSFVWALSIASAILAAVLINLSIAEAFSSTVDSLLFFIKSRWVSSWIVISFNACGLIVDIGLILWIASIVFYLVS